MSGGRVAVVVTTSAPLEVLGVADVEVCERGVLWLRDGDGGCVAVYAAGFWRSVEMVVEEAAPDAGDREPTGLDYRAG